MAKDIIYYEGDINFDNGDFSFQEADNTAIWRGMHAEDIIMDEKGQWYQSPLVGVGINKALGGNTNPLIEAEVIRQLVLDKFKINEISVTFVTGGDFTIEVNADKG